MYLRSFIGVNETVDELVMGMSHWEERVELLLWWQEYLLYRLDIIV